MLKIVEIGEFKCDKCRGRKKKPGVEIQGFGYRIQVPVVFSSMTEEEKAEARKKKRFDVWREQVHLCLDHLKEFIGKMIDDLPIGGMWSIHQRASANPKFVNTTYEEMQAKGLR